MLKLKQAKTIYPAQQIYAVQDMKVWVYRGGAG
jgi:hypothetical protein